MYAKMLFNKELLYFRYAPPLTDLDGATDDRPNPPFRDAPKQCCSVYYYWWAFLKDNVDYIACCENGGSGPMAKLYSDFGDVRGDSFMTWWSDEGRLLFCEPEIGRPFTHLSPPNRYDERREVLMTIPITGDLERTVAEVRTLLRDAMQRHRWTMRKNGRSETEVPGPKYPVHSKPVLTSLHQTLMIWQAKKNLGDEATQAEIGKEAGIASTRVWGAGDVTTTALTASTVSRAISDARNLIRNVGEGRFPDKSSIDERAESAIDIGETTRRRDRASTAIELTRRSFAAIRDDG